MNLGLSKFLNLIQMVQSMKVRNWMEWNMDREHFFIKIMVEFMRVSGLKIKYKVKVIYSKYSLLGTLFYASGKPAYEG